MTLPTRLAIEHLHLLFARALCAGPDKTDFAIKGGCNLRFFFGSVRYSEDLDIDVQRIPVRTLRGRVDKLLSSPALLLPLKARGLRLGDLSAPKQTETTQRWKIALHLEGHSVPLHTKIEFSRRVRFEDAVLGPIEGGFASEHQLQPVLLPHYPLGAAIRQKAFALLLRREVQARDVFDLSVLFAKAGHDLSALHPLRAELPKAIDRALGVSFDDYQAQVVSYLAPEHIDALGSRAAWSALQAHVVDTLDRGTTSP